MVLRRRRRPSTGRTSPASPPRLRLRRRGQAWWFGEADCLFGGFGVARGFNYPESLPSFDFFFSKSEKAVIPLFVDVGSDCLAVFPARAVRLGFGDGVE
jgi:hypothetical protein